MNKGNKCNAIIHIPLNDGALLIRMIVWNWIYPSTHLYTVQKEGHKVESVLNTSPALSSLNMVTSAKVLSFYGLQSPHL